MSSREAVEVRGLAMGIKAKTFIPITVKGTTFRIAFPVRDFIGIVSGKLLLKMEIPLGGVLEFKLEDEIVRLHFPQRDKIVIDGDRQRVIVGKRTLIPAVA
jgi:hypothetical protein